MNASDMCCVFHAGSLIATTPLWMLPCLSGSILFSQMFKSSENICSSGITCEVSMLKLVRPALPVSCSAELWLHVCTRALLQATCVSYLKLCCGFAVERLQSLGAKANSMIWWPTTQHGLVEEGHVQVIDSRSGEHFNALSSDQEGNACLEQRYDGCASWWTQVIHPSLPHANLMPGH